MIGIDTNALLRFIVADDRVQAEMVRALIERDCSPENPGFVNLVVLAETVWVLQRGYGLGRLDIAQVVENLLLASSIVVEEHGVVRTTLQYFRDSTVGFTDILLAEINRANGCETTATFDRKAAKLKGFTLIR